MDAGLCAIVISSPVARLHPFRALVASSIRTGQLHESADPDPLGIADLVEYDVFERAFQTRLASAFESSALSATAVASCVCVSANSSSELLF